MRASFDRLGADELEAAEREPSPNPAGVNDQTPGTIKSIDRSTNKVTLQNGEMFNVAKSVNLANLRPGEKVTVTFTKSGNMMDATAIQRAP